MKKGVINYDSFGKPICNICGKGYNKLISHVVQKHNISAIEYKETYGYDLHKSILSKKAEDNARKNAVRNMPKYINNLIKSGEKTRFKNGHKGRTKDKVSQQTLNRIKNQINTINKNKNERRSK